MLSTVQHVFLQDQHSQFQPEESTPITTAINSNLPLFCTEWPVKPQANIGLPIVVEPEEAYFGREGPG